VGPTYALIPEQASQRADSSVKKGYASKIAFLSLISLIHKSLKPKK
jgi:hypothetical protein